MTEVSAGYIVWGARAMLGGVVALLLLGLVFQQTTDSSLVKEQEMADEAVKHSLVINNTDWDRERDVESFVFIKFHKVGSSTLAVPLARMASAMGFEIEPKCFGGQYAACLNHNGMRIMQGKRRSLGTKPLERITLIYPKAFMVTIMRDPLDKMMSWVYYFTYMKHLPQTEEWFMDNMDALWEKSAEYMHTLVGLNATASQVDDALAVLQKFDVVGITQDVPGTLAQVIHLLHLGPESVQFQSITVMTGRPRFEDHSQAFQQAILERVNRDGAPERILYTAAKALHESRMKEFHLEGLRDEISALSSSADDIDCSRRGTGFGTVGGSTCIALDGDDDGEDMLVADEEQEAQS